MLQNVMHSKFLGMTEFGFYMYPLPTTAPSANGCWVDNPTIPHPLRFLHRVLQLVFDMLLYLFSNRFLYFSFPVEFCSAEGNKKCRYIDKKQSRYGFIALCMTLEVKHENSIKIDMSLNGLSYLCGAIQSLSLTRDKELSIVMSV